MRRLLPIGVAAAMGTSLFFTGTASAHNINLETAKAKVRPYVSQVLNDPSRGYVQAITRCSRAFSGHNHYIRCTVQYENAESKNVDGVFACTEKVEAYHQSHRDGINYQIYRKHTSPPCGSITLRGPNP